jgi:uncharacterized protein YhjY with autotransporter beta-barrel domain
VDYISRYTSNTIGIYNPATGALISSFSNGISGPAGIAFGNGDIYVANQGSGAITTYNSSNVLINSFNTGTDEEGLGFGPDGNLYLGTASSHIAVFSTSGTLLHTWTIPGAQTEGVAFDGSKLVVADLNGGRLFVLNTSGTVLGTISGLNLPVGVAVAPNGEVYVVDNSNVDIISIGTNFGQTAGLTPNQQSVGANIDGYMGAVNPGTFGQLVNALTNLPVSQLGAALDQLSPLQFSQFASETAFNNAAFETQEMDNYLASRRGGGGDFLGSAGGIDASGLALNDPSYDSALAMVHSRLLAWNPAPLDGALSDVADPLLGGTDMKEMKAAPAESDPWNFFIRGNVILAQGFSGPGVSHFDDNSESVVLGADYRIDPNWLVGLTAGYAHTDVSLDDIGSSATVDSYSPGCYVSYADRGWYANFAGDYIHNAYTQDRVIGLIGQTASSAPEGNEAVADLDGGYDFHRGAFTFGPLAGVQYTHLAVDGYNETGSVADLSVAENEADSLRSRLGGRVSYTFSHYGITFTPHLDASWQHEFLDQSRGITSQFSSAGLGSFSVRTANPSRDSALIDFGLEADFDRSWTLFADYLAQAGQDNYFGQSIQAGVKIAF